MSALKYWLWLVERQGLGPAGVVTVLDHFVTAERAYYASRAEYERLPLRSNQIADVADKSLDRAERILESCQRLGVGIITMQDACYPQRLRVLADPPSVLYCRGRSFLYDEEVGIAVVGARACTPYGELWAGRFGMELTAAGALVVSGMAEGVDSCALRGALRAGGPVVSVLAGGVDMPFPPENRALHEDVATVGALISEYPPGTPHRGHHFLRRNRILSGLCLGVLAVECRPFGGTMNTVNHALDQGRDVFALPGALGAPMSEGPNRLIQQGAKLVTCTGDILEEYQEQYPGKLNREAPLPPDVVQARLESLARERTERAAHRAEQKAKPEKPEKQPESGPTRTLVPRREQKRRFTDDQLMLLAAMGTQVRSADQLVELTQIPTKRVLSALTMLQIQGDIEERPGRRFASLVELEE